MNDLTELTFTTTADSVEAGLINEENYAVVNVAGQWKEFVINSIKETDESDLLIDVQASLSSVELQDSIIEKQISGSSLTVLTAGILQGTRWTVGTIESGIYNRSFTENLQYMNVLEALFLLQKEFNCDIHFSYVVDGNKISKRQVNFYARVGANNGKRFEIDKDVTSIEREIDTSQLATAIYPIQRKTVESTTGGESSEIIVDISTAVWKKSEGKPVDKPAGQKIIVDPEALKQWGRIGSNMQLMNRVKLYEFNDEVSVEQMMQMSWVNLGKYTQPKVTYTAKVLDLYSLLGADYLHEKVTIGDSAVIIDNYFAKPIRTEARVTEIIRNLIDPTDNEIVLGDAKSDFTSSRSSSQSELSNALKEAYKANQNSYSALLSANGKNTNFFGSIEPSVKHSGDTWFRPHPDDPTESQMLQWDGTQWQVILDTKTLVVDQSIIDDVRKAAEDAQKAGEDAQKAADEAKKATEDQQKILDEYDSAIKNANSKADTAISDSTKAISDATNSLNKANEASAKADKAVKDSFDSTTIANQAKVDAANAVTKGNNNATEISKLDTEIKATATKVDGNTAEIAQVKIESGKLSTTVGKVETDLETSMKEFSTFEQSMKGFQTTVNSDIAGVKSQQTQMAGQISSTVETVNNITAGNTNLLRRYGEIRGSMIDPSGGYTNYYTATRSIYPIAVVGDTYLTFSQKKDVLSTDDAFRFVFKDSAGKVVQRLADANTQFTIQVPKGAVTLEVSYQYYNQVKIELGKKVTDWQPAPSDMASKTELLQTADSITSSVTTTTDKLDVKSRIAGGLSLNADPEFRKGMNGITTYNNAGNGTVTVVREKGDYATNGWSTPTDSGYRLAIKVTGEASPARGGVVCNTMSRINAEFVVRFTALLPAGRVFQPANNSLGTGATVKWLTSNTGTGTWEEYMYHVKCGNSGTFQSFGYLYVTGGGIPTATDPLVWYLAKYEIIDITQSQQTRITQLSDSINSTVQKVDGLDSKITSVDQKADSITSRVVNVESGQATQGSQITQMAGQITSIVGFNDRKNLLPFMEDGDINNTTGAEVVSTTRVRSPFIAVSSSIPRYAFSVNGASRAINVIYYNEKKERVNSIPSNTASFPLLSNPSYIRITVVKETTENSKYQLEAGSSATAYSPFNNNASQSQITQLSDQIVLSVKKDGLLGEINLQAGKTLIRQGDNVLMVTPDTTYIQNATIKTAHIADASITNAKIGSLAVNTAQIANAAITTAKIGNLAVGNAQIANAAINAVKIQDASITSAKILNLDAGKITTGTLSAITVVGVTISGSKIFGTDIEGGTIRTSKDDGSLSLRKGYMYIEDAKGNGCSSFGNISSYGAKSTVLMLDADTSGFYIGASPLIPVAGMFSVSPLYGRLTTAFDCVKYGMSMVHPDNSSAFGIASINTLGVLGLGGNNGLEFLKTASRTGVGATSLGTWGTSSLTITTGLNVKGSKNAIHVTRDGVRATPAYETAESYLGDIGRSVTGSNKEVFVPIEELFGDTVNTDIPYVVFLQTETNSMVYVKDYSAEGFTVASGKANVPFSYEIKAKRRGYEHERLVLQEDFDNSKIADVWRD